MGLHTFVSAIVHLDRTSCTIGTYFALLHVTPHPYSRRIATRHSQHTLHHPSLLPSYLHTLDPNPPPPSTTIHPGLLPRGISSSHPYHSSPGIQPTLSTLPWSLTVACICGVSQSHCSHLGLSSSIGLTERNSSAVWPPGRGTSLALRGGATAWVVAVWGL